MRICASRWRSNVSFYRNSPRSTNAKPAAPLPSVSPLPNILACHPNLGPTPFDLGTRNASEGIVVTCFHAYALGYDATPKWHRQTGLSPNSAGRIQRQIKPTSPSAEVEQVTGYSPEITQIDSMGSNTTAVDRSATTLTCVAVPPICRWC